MLIWGSCQVPQDSLDRSPGKRHREGSPYALLTRPHVRAWRASLASKWATGTPVAAVPCVLRALLHIFPNENCHCFLKSQFFGLKRNVKHPCCLKYTLFQCQHFWLKIIIFSFGWSWAPLSGRSAPMQRGARFFQKQCFPCSVALVLGRGSGASGRPGATPKHQRVRW